MRYLPFILFILSACNPVRTTWFAPEFSQEQQPAKRRTSAPQCGAWQGYVPDAAHPEYLPTKLIRVNFQILNSLDSSQNFREEAGRKYLRRLLDLANSMLDSNIRNWRSPEGTLVLPTRYRYVLTPLPGDDGFRFHYHDTHYAFVASGKNRNNYDQKVTELYKSGGDTVLNIFVLVHHPDSVKSKWYKAGSQGIALGNCLKMAGLFEKGQPPEHFAGLLNHEIGHILSLSHAWMGDGCPDTEDHPNRCWEWTPDPPCNTLATNNVMDYNAYQHAFTPCQIGKVQAALANENHLARKCVVFDFCTRRPELDVVITDSTSWNGARDIGGNITVAPGGILHLQCRVSMPEGSQITVQPGGKLILANGVKVHNACGKPWKGIAVEKKGKLEGTVIREGDVKF